MRIIDLNAPISRRTVLSYGDSRSGKTHFAATFPRPLFLSDVTESGWNTIAKMNHDSFYEPKRTPLVWGIEKMSDMAQAQQDVLPLIKDGSVQTIVIDSITFYADLYLAGLINAQGGKPDMRRAYGDLGNHLRDLRVKWHSMAVNVVWLALAKEPEKNDAGQIVTMGTALIPGNQGAKFAAGCDSVFYHKATRGPTGMAWQIRTQQHNGFITGGREGDHPLPDPLPGNSYRDYLAALTSKAQPVTESAAEQLEIPGTLNGAPVATPPTVRKSFAPTARR